jgi:hypothetical protein
MAVHDGVHDGLAGFAKHRAARLARLRPKFDRAATPNAYRRAYAAPQRRFSGLPNLWAGGSITLPTRSRAELQTSGGGEWDKTSEVLAVHGA